MGAIALCTGVASADSVTPDASRDNTMFESSGGALSSGAGAYIHVGRLGGNGGGLRRRGLIMFDVAESVPAGSTVTSAVLRLGMFRTAVGAQNISAHRVTNDWGEGASSAINGQGAASQTGDASWTHTFFSTGLWNQAGGDFVAGSSATTPVSDSGFYTWSSAQMVTDLQLWLDGTAPNYGWVLIGNESVLKTMKRFDSRENATPGNRPQLTIGYQSAAADLELRKIDDLDPLITDDTLTYTLTVTNLGPGSAENVTITDTLPAGVTPIGPIVTNVGTLAPGSGLSIQIIVQAGTNTTGVITNQATVVTSSSDTNAGNDVATEQTTIPDADGDGEADFSDPDDDGDGIPDTYEIMFGLNPTNAADGVLDTDFDGFSNFDEYVSNTDPTNPTSFFDIDLVNITNSVLLIFETSTGRVYTLKFSDDIESGIWSNFPGLIDVPGTGTNSFLDSNDVPRRFYQINVDLP